MLVVGIVSTAAGSQRSGAAGWAGYSATPTESGNFTISGDGQTVSGTLPPGFSKENPPSDAADPGMAQRIKNAPHSAGLHVSAPTLATPIQAGFASVMSRRPTRSRTVAADNNPVGCVTAISVINGGLDYKGQMAGCAYGHLWLHTYLNAYSTRVQDGITLDCYSTTHCSVPYSFYTANPNCRTFYNYAHGHNYTTGGDSIAWQQHAPWAC